MRRLLPLLLFSSLLRAEEPPLPEGFPPGRVIETEHFILHHEGAFAPVGVTGLVEGLRAKLMLDLSDFAPWANRTKIDVFVYADSGSYVAKTGIPAWSAAFADPALRRIHCYDSPHLARVMAHEMAHLFFMPYFEERDVQPPVWLNEGLAKMMEWSHGQEADTGQMNLHYFSKGRAAPLHEMMAFDYHHSAASSDGVGVWYQQSASVTAYLLRRFPRAQFVTFCSALRDGKTSDEALRLAYGFQVADVASLERLWKDSLTEK